MQKVFVVGVGMTAFLKPDPSNPQFDDMVYEASNKALQDAGL